MNAALVAVLAVTAALAVGCGGSRSSGSPAGAARGPLLAGQVQVVRYSSSNVRICPNFATALDFGPPHPPPCADGPRAVGVDTSLLTEHAQGKTERWGDLYLVGRYGSGVFTVTSQRLHGPPPPSPPSLDKPPCPTPPGGWLLATRTDAQQRSLEHYSKLAGHRDLVDIAFFDQGSVLTVASSNPARTRAVLGPYWRRQLCIVKARYSRATLVGVGKRLVRLMTSPRSAAYGWITGAGGTCGNVTGQPTTCLQLLVETPQLRALLRRLPRGIVEVKAALSPVRRMRRRPAAASTRRKVTRAKAVERLGRLLGAKPQRVHLVWADERTTDVVLRWTAYAPRAHLRSFGGPIGGPPPRPYVGPAVAWLSASGRGSMGVGSVGPPRGQQVLPLRSTSIPVSLLRALWRNHARVRLTPLRVHPAISRIAAIAKLRQWGDRKGHLQGIWLVRFRRGGGGLQRLAWLAVALRARIPVLGCTMGKKCRPWYTSPLASFLDARTGKLVQAMTINGWWPQLPPG